MNIQRLAAFADGDVGGNPAGVVITDHALSDQEMQTIAAQVGYSETVFAVPQERGFRVRYFAPESEVPFCGHATIALGAALALQFGNGEFALQLNHAAITVSGQQMNGKLHASLQSPPTHSEIASAEQLSAVLNLFSYTQQQIDQRLPPAVIHGGASHFMLALNSREALAAMQYELNDGRLLMRKNQWATIMLVFAKNAQEFDVRNPFASGGVYEDPATGAAAAAFAGYLRDIAWQHQGRIRLNQGDDMGVPSRINAEFSAQHGSSVRLSGHVRLISV